MLNNGKISILLDRIDLVREMYKEEGLFSTAEDIFQWYKNFGFLPYLLSRLHIRSKYGKNKLILKEIQGNNMYLNTDDPGISTELLIRGTHEPSATKILKDILDDRKVRFCLDIGSNIGYYAIIEGKSVCQRGGRVFAIEPEPNNFELLTNNIGANNLTNIIECRNCAIADRNGYSKFYISKKSNQHSLCITPDKQKCIMTKVMTLDSFLFGKTVDLIRMDIEGYEYDVLSNSDETLRRKNLNLFVEFHPPIMKSRNLSIKDLLERLQKFGFEPISIVNRHNENKVYRDMSMQDLIENNVSRSVFIAFLRN